MFAAVDSKIEALINSGRRRSKQGKTDATLICIQILIGGGFDLFFFFFVIICRFRPMKKIEGGEKRNYFFINFYFLHVSVVTKINQHLFV